MNEESYNVTRTSVGVAAKRPQLPRTAKHGDGHASGQQVRQDCLLLKPQDHKRTCPE